MASFTYSSFGSAKAVRAVAINFLTKGYIDDIEVIYADDDSTLKDIYAYDSIRWQTNTGGDTLYTTVSWTDCGKYPGFTMAWLYKDSSNQNWYVYSVPKTIIHDKQTITTPIQFQSVLNNQNVYNTLDFDIGTSSYDVIKIKDATYNFNLEWDEHIII
jgi:hypothetical protein